ncbi:phospholipase B1, membrane-associated-like [Nelusetta ayraudi]|uniref:phospholipase B1, membrane-associated-like n=1 Tax=Nelusetta ayraudi TaxID=303726 RepID=UPI003F7202FF
MEKMLQRLVLVAALASTTVATQWPCSHMSPSATPPSNVNSVRPSDVAVFHPVGLDGHGTDLSNVVSRLRELMTLFNPALVGLLPEETSLYSPHFVGRSTLTGQVEEMSARLRNTQGVDMDKDWKLIPLFIQMDQLCACDPQQFQSALRDVDEALQLLNAQVKRAIVSVALWDGGPGRFHSKVCSCMEEGSEGGARLQRAVLSQALQESLEDLMVQRSWYGDGDDFAVVLQRAPLIAEPPSVSSGASLREASQQTDNLMVQVWTDLLQPPSGQPSADDKGNVISLPCPAEDRPFLRTEGNSPSRGGGGGGGDGASPLLDPLTGTEMPCKDLAPSPSTPTSVHELRPGDIKVVAAVGDSLTAGNGIGANPNNILEVLTQYRGLSWSIGGDGNLTAVTTLPNILRHFNPNLMGYSNGTGTQDTPQAFLNQAVTGAKTKDLASQLQALVKRMKNDPRINFESDWKVITLFVGGNDLCDHCYNSLLFSAETYARTIQESLDYLHKEVPRTLVNLVEPLYINPLREMHLDPSLKCPTWLIKIICPCVILPKEDSQALQMVNKLNRDYQRAVRELVESGRYDTRSDFTVVIQPFLRDIVVPKLPDGRPDRSYFSPDCFHLSQKAQTLMARSLWNNMLEPLGNKTAFQDFASVIELKCPTTAAPFIRTYNNSDYVYAGPAPTTGPITNWGSDFSCADLAPSDTVPTSVHELRPADIKVVAALGDSATSATAAKATNLLNLGTDYRGVSWSIGGDKTLDSVTTLPNILKKFNPSVRGFSRGQAQRQKGFNMALAEAKISEIPAQVQALIKAMKEHKEVNFDSDWKLVTVYVGTNDLCAYCNDQVNLSPQNYTHNLMLGLDMLYSQVPRLLVNVVELMQLDPVKTVMKSTIGCSFFSRMSCPCLINPHQGSPEIEEFKRVNHMYQVEMQQLISGSRYEGKEDFAVVLQPFLQNYFIPQVGVGEADSSFFSVDCFHLSERAHAEMAIGLWNNMLEPVGEKQTYNNFTYDRSKIRCPSEASPFIFTKVNSLGPVVPTPTTDTSTVSSSSVPVNTTPSNPECPTDIPVWVPVVVGVACLVTGFAVAGIIFSCLCQKKKEAYEMEMKGTGF